MVYFHHDQFQNNKIHIYYIYMKQRARISKVLINTLVIHTNEAFYDINMSNTKVPSIKDRRYLLIRKIYLSYASCDLFFCSGRE